MKKLISMLLVIALVLSVGMTAVFAAPRGKNCTGTQHRAQFTDANKDGICDVCGSRDANNDGICDDCRGGKNCTGTQHRAQFTDANKDGICDVCGSRDANNDGICDDCPRSGGGRGRRGK